MWVKEILSMYFNIYYVYMKNLYKYLPTTLLLAPFLVSAQGNEIVDSELGGFIVNIQGFINDLLIPLVFGFALIFFLYGVFNYFIVGKNQTDKKAEGRSYMVWSIAGFVLMVSVWGIVALLASVIPTSGAPVPPSIITPLST